MLATNPKRNLDKFGVLNTEGVIRHANVQNVKDRKKRIIHVSAIRYLWAHLLLRQPRQDGTALRCNILRRYQILMGNQIGLIRMCWCWNSQNSSKFVVAMQFRWLSADPVSVSPRRKAHPYAPMVTISQELFITKHAKIRRVWSGTSQFSICQLWYWIIEDADDRNENVSRYWVDILYCKLSHLGVDGEWVSIGRQHWATHLVWCPT